MGREVQQLGKVHLIWQKLLYGCLSKDQEVADIWTAWELLSAYKNPLLGKFETLVVRQKLSDYISVNYSIAPGLLWGKQLIASCKLDDVCCLSSILESLP